MTPSEQKKERGFALLMVVISIAILTVVGTDFAYNSRVDLQLAANQRDEVRAYYMAQSSIALSRLLLVSQKQLDSAPMIGGGLGGLLGGATPGGAATGAASGL